MSVPAHQPLGELRVAVTNLEFGGLSDTGDDSAWCKSMACLLDWAPHMLLIQEMNGRLPYRLQAHLWRTANELGLTPVLGPASPDSVSGNHPAVLVSTAGGLQILDAGPPPGPAGGAAPAWCEALVAVPGMEHAVWLLSVHLPARSATSQHIQAERLANLVAQRGGLVIAGGDWNSYAPDGQLTQPALEALPAHLRPARMRLCADGRLEPDYHVHRALASVGLADAAAALPAARRTPPQLTPNGVTGGARVDRIYLTACLVPALERYQQAATGGSDHQALLLTLRTEAATSITPPPPLP
jgi:hypothetical protein